MRIIIWGGYSGDYSSCDMHTMVAAACRDTADEFYDLKEYMLNDETPIRAVKNISAHSQVHSKRQRNAPVAGRNY